MTAAALDRPAGRNPVLRWLGRGLAALAVLALVASAGVFAVAQWRLNMRWPAAPEDLRIAPAPAMVAEGERAFHVFGCYGCHAEAGKVLFEAPNVGRLVAPNVFRRAAAYSDAELVRLVRRGVKRDGTSALVMPAANLGRVSDRDLAAIVAYVRHAPVPRDGAPPTQWGPLGYVALAAGKVALSAQQAGHGATPMARPAGGEGAYIVGAVCAECHDLDKVRSNGWDMTAPPLRAMAQVYPLEDFRRLLRTGKGMTRDNLGVMSGVAREDLSHLTDAEIEAVHRYLREGR
ncbi:MAG TPA: c-type cytochrome [Caulobacteraceae bacterium]|nr:c-type cytochrome [Caulobacteraceae bacterium]